MRRERGYAEGTRGVGRGVSKLTAEQMEAMLRDSPYRRQAGKRLENCPGCSEEVENLAEVLGRFRATAEAYAGQRQMVREPVRDAERRGASGTVAWRWSIAAGALACGLLAAPLVHRTAEHRASVVRDSTPARAVEMSDEALLEGVREDLASSVPAPLEMLAAASGSVKDSGSAGGASGSRAGSRAKH